MTHPSTSKWLHQLKAEFRDLDLFPPASPRIIADAEKAVGSLPPELAELLACSNGLACRSFRLYSALDRRHIKKTWESLQRANNLATAAALSGDADLLSRFLVFADIGDGVALFDRTDWTIWFNESDDNEIRQTNLSFREFIETMLENAE
jgi:hypothetical protein